MKQSAREKIILKRLDRVYLRLGPSEVHGVGIFAIKRIPKGTNPFKDSYMCQDAMLINKSKLSDQPDSVKKLLEDYNPSRPFFAEGSVATKVSNEQVIRFFPNQLCWTDYLNYSEEPNIQLMDDGEWVTLRQIEEGEELLENPDRLFNTDGSPKVFKVSLGQYPNLNY